MIGRWLALGRIWICRCPAVATRRVGGGGSPSLPRSTSSPPGWPRRTPTRSRSGRTRVESIRDPVELWGVWAAESRDAVLVRASDAGNRGDARRHQGVVLGCRASASHALVTARTRRPGTVDCSPCDLRGSGVQPLPSTWRNPGMAESDTRSVQFSDAPAIPVGQPRRVPVPAGLLARRDRCRACWLGGVAGGGALRSTAAAPRRRRSRIRWRTSAPSTPRRPRRRRCCMAAAAEVDADPLNRKGIGRTDRATYPGRRGDRSRRDDHAHGACPRPGPLCQDAQHAKRVADLTIYVRQSHAERDLEQLGRLAGRPDDNRPGRATAPASPPGRCPAMEPRRRCGSMRRRACPNWT